MDTISFKLMSCEVPGIDMFKNASACLNCIDYGYRYGFNYIRGKLKNLDVLVTENYLKVYNGSLSKFLLDSNLNELSREDVQNAIENLSDILQLPIERSIVQKLHYGINTIVDYDTTLYYPYFGHLYPFNRLEQPFGLNYKINERELVIYDKIREMKAHREQIHPLFKNKHVIRVEMRYHKNIGKYFKIPDLRVAHLFNDKFYNGLKNDLFATYNRINKIKPIGVNMEKVKTKRQLYMAGIIALIEKEGGYLNALNSLSERYKKGDLTKKQFHDLKSAFNLNKRTLFQKNNCDLLSEFESKINMQISYPF
jgi:hypothetical protein